MSKYVAPNYKNSGFTCPHCTALASMKWTFLHITADYYPVAQAVCAACDLPNYWRVEWVGAGNNRMPLGAELMWPQVVTAPAAHPDLFPDLHADYEEARQIAGHSPRAAAALLRLVIEKLVTELGAKGGSINEQIGDLVKKGLSVQVQQALDTVRVIGNNAVHPAQMDQADVEATATQLFGLVNIIVERLITEPKQLNTMFGTLPESARNGIAKRDGKPS